MIVPKSIADVEKMIQDQVQENIHLDYKRSAAIRRGSRERDELAKDVSSFANSDGGVLIYGVEEKDQLPIKIDGGVDDSESSREWIESALMTGITPRLADVRILPLVTTPGRTMYVIEIAKTFRGPHQASDKRYYKRHNFKSVPMEDYEISDVRNRRKHLPPILTFQVGEYRRFIATVDVANISDVVAEDVHFEFPDNLPWPLQPRIPPLFANGISKFPPKQSFRFLLCEFWKVLSGTSGVPLEFSVRISYYHPEAGSRVTDEWPVNFAAYEHSSAVRPEMEEQAKDISEVLGKLKDELVGLNKALQKFASIPGSTGLDLSIPTLRNLKRVLIENKDPEPIQAEGCDWQVFKELLGVDVQLAYQISTFFRFQSNPEKLSEIPGMTDETLAKIRATFIIPSPPQKNDQSE
jgi:hypothetical protein